MSTRYWHTPWGTQAGDVEPEADWVEVDEAEYNRLLADFRANREAWNQRYRDYLNDKLRAPYDELIALGMSPAGASQISGYRSRVEA